MTTLYPTSLQDLDATRGSNNDKLSSPNHVTHHTTEDDTIEALQTKVGIDGSAVTTTHDYKLSGVTGSDKAVSKTGTEVLTNKTLSTGSKVLVGSDATGDIYYNGGSGVITRKGIGADGKILKVVSGLPSWETETVTVDASTTVKGIVEAATSSEVSAGTATGGTGAVLVVTPDALAASNYPKSVDIQSFTTAGSTSWTKPTGAKLVEVYMVAGGGGGGSGGAYSGGPNGGGGGGGGGSFAYKKFNASSLGSTENLTVGTGGNGGASVSANTQGNDGNNGTDSTFGTIQLLVTKGGTKGTKGTLNGVGSQNNGGAGGVVANGDIVAAGGTGGQGGYTSNSGDAGTDTAGLQSPRGGGGGAGSSNGANFATNTNGVGGAFITNYVLAGGAIATIGNSGINFFYGGTGGGGSSSANSGLLTGGAGIYGSGAGGGGASINTVASGAGGKGGDGFIIIISYF